MIFERYVALFSALLIGKSAINKCENIIMVPLYYKLEISLRDGSSLSWIKLNDSVEVKLVNELVVVVASNRARLFPRCRKQQYVEIGEITSPASETLKSLISSGAYLRTRVVDVVPLHLKPKCRNLVFISIWIKEREMMKVEVPAHLKAIYDLFGAK